MDWEAFADILKESIILTVVVVAMMVLIEIFNFTSKGRLLHLAGRTRFAQVVLAGLLGVAPGCIGGYVSVSMYSKRMFTFGALVSMMIATTGDEAFLMLAMFPKTAVFIFAGLLTLGIITGTVINAFDHSTPEPLPETADLHDEACCHEHHRHNETCPSPLRDRILHTLGHALKVFAWTFGILVAVQICEQFVDLEAWVNDNTALMVLFAALVGLLPLSGPHMVFVTMFASGVLPLPVLIASCLSQDGHAGLPLIAGHRRAFVQAKALKLVMALAAGYIAMLVM